MNERHIHADIIIAWANGAEIEYQGASGNWHEIAFPDWNNGEKYRIKPKPVKKEGWVNVYSNITTGSTIYTTKEEAIAKACPEAVATILIEWEVEE